MKFEICTQALLLTFVVVSASANGDDAYCDLSSYRFLKSDEYPFRSSALQIFSTPMVSCTGLLKGWKFLASAQTIVDLRLAVFRRYSSKQGDFFVMRNQTLIDIDFNQQFQDRLFRSWITVYLPEPYEVKRGEYIGIFYGQASINLGDPAISTRRRTVFYDKPNATYDTYQYFKLDATRFNPSKALFVKKANLTRQLIPALVPMIEAYEISPVPVSANVRQGLADDSGMDRGKTPGKSCTFIASSCNALLSVDGLTFALAVVTLFSLQ